MTASPLGVAAPLPSLTPATGGRPPPASTILVLGSKPRPALPPAGAYAAVACANASGFSARAHGLRLPAFTVVSAVLGSGNASDNHSLAALRGLQAGQVYFLPRPLPAGAWRQLRFQLRHWRLQAPWVRHLLRRHGLVFDRFEQRPTDAYDRLLLELAGGDPAVAGLMAQKRPSTGLVAVALGLTEAGFSHAILAGFDFTLAHAYGHNPLIDQRGQTLSKHADTDIAILAAILARRGCLWTSEPAVAARTGIPLLAAVDG
jgi:hypothetical protein